MKNATHGGTVSVRPDEPAPYAPSSAIIDIIDRYRNKGLSTPISAEVLARVGVTDSLIPRTLKSLQQLDLIGEDGRPTAQLEGLRRATTEEFKPRLADVVRSAYADVFQFADPATDDETRVTDAFRLYNPVSMRPRMISLFLGLCEAAGIIPEREAKTTRSGTGKKPAAKRTSDTARPQRAATVRYNVRTDDGLGLVPEPILGLIRAIPLDGWTQARRDKFISTFEHVLDFAIPILDHEPRDQSEGEHPTVPVRGRPVRFE
jgi:hypothetical protein